MPYLHADLPRICFGFEMLYKDVKTLQWEHGGVYVEKCQGDAWKEDLAGRVKKKKKI